MSSDVSDFLVTVLVGFEGGEAEEGFAEGRHVHEHLEAAVPGEET